MSARQKAAREYHDRILQNTSEAREDAWDADAIHGPEMDRAIKEARRRYDLSVRLECIRRARIRSGATCP